MLPVRVLIVDDHEVVRTGVRALLEAVDSVRVVGEAEDVEGAVALVGSLAPDVVILDLRLGSQSGLEACRQILRSRPATRVLMLSAHCDEEAAAEAISMGAAGFLLKRSTGRELVRAVKAARRSEAIIDAEVARRLSVAAARGLASDRMSEHEHELARMIATGLTNAEIATRLGVPEASVKISLSRLYARLGVTHRAQLPARLAELAG